MAPVLPVNPWLPVKPVAPTAPVIPFEPGAPAFTEQKDRLVALNQYPWRSRSSNINRYVLFVTETSYITTSDAVNTVDYGSWLHCVQ